MDATTFYDYLTHARRELWESLRAVPDETLSASVIPGTRFHSIKDLLFHIPAGEDWWLHENIVEDQPIWEAFPELGKLTDGRQHADQLLSRLLDYWQQVEASSLGYLKCLTPEELGRTITFGVPRGEVSFIVGDALWHVMQHEVRHMAQVVLLLRLAGCTPPALDLDNYLLAHRTPAASEQG